MEKVSVESLIDEVVRESRTIAVVGASRDPSKDSHEVAAYLKQHGFRIIPVNPFSDEILGEKCYKSLLDIPQSLRSEIDVVDIFRPSEDVPPIVDQAIQIRTPSGKPKVIWMQLGIMNEKAAKRAEEAGMNVIMDRCLMVEARRRGR
jgi:predicted CoA-binding protein